MLNVLRPSFEVVKEGRIFLTEKMSWKYSFPLQEHHLTNSDEIKENGIPFCGINISC